MSAHAASTRPVTFERERGVYRADVARDLAHASVTVGDGSDRPERVQQILDLLRDAGIPIFLIKLHADTLAFGVDGRKLPEVERCLGDCAIASAVRRDLALITVRASSMSDLTGVMVDIADSLQRAGARLIGVGDSHNSVQLLIEGANADAAVAELESTFGLGARDA